MKKLFLVIFVLCIIFVVAIFWLKLFIQHPTLTIRNQTFSLLLATTTQQQQLGLGERASLPNDSGMYFIFQKPDYYSFWMKGMKFPLDIIFLRNNKIIAVYMNIQPPSSHEVNLPTYSSAQPADAVLEINAGLAKRYHFQKGDMVKLNL